MILALLLAAAPVADTPPPATRSLYLQLIHQARADGRPRAAIAYLDDFDHRYPGDADARALRVNSLLDLGDIDAAEAVAATLPAAPALKGHLLAARARWAEAIPFYESAIAASSVDPLLRNALGYAQLRAGQASQAVQTLRSASDLAPSERVIRNNLLLALATNGQRAEVDALLAQIRDPAEREALRTRIPTDSRLAVERQLRSPPRTDPSTGLSAEEAAAIHQRYLQSIGERPPQPSSDHAPAP